MLPAVGMFYKEVYRASTWPSDTLRADDRCLPVLIELKTDCKIQNFWLIWGKVKYVRQSSHILHPRIRFLYGAAPEGKMKMAYKHTGSKPESNEKI